MEDMADSEEDSQEASETLEEILLGAFPEAQEVFLEEEAHPEEAEPAEEYKINRKKRIFRNNFE